MSTTQTTVGKLLGMPGSNRTFEGSHRLALRKCLTGLEFEAENVQSRLPAVEEAGWWGEKKDDSLRGNSMEYVLREPLFGQDLISAIEFLCKWGSEKKLESNFRTGLHVHVDCRNMTTNQLLTMIVFYALFEKVIFSYVDKEATGNQSREGSIFCMPMYKAEGVLEKIVRALKAEEGTMVHKAKEIERYSAFNLNALSRFGSVEWRHMQTTFNSEKVIKWVNVAQGFKRYALANPLQPKELLAELSKMGPDRIFAGIVGPELAGELWTKESDRQVMSVGIPIAQEIAILLDNSANLAWDTARGVIGSGSSPLWINWVKREKGKKELEKLPDNLFSEPELMLDPEIQKIALKGLSESIIDQLSSVTL